MKITLKQIEEDMDGKEFNLKEFGFKAAADYLKELEGRWGAWFVMAQYRAESHSIVIWATDDAG